MKYFSTMLVTCLRKPILILGRIYTKIYSYWYSVQFKACGKNFRIDGRSLILSPENITIGKNFSSMGNLYLYGNGGEVLVGDNVALNTNVQIGAGGGGLLSAAMF